MALAGPLAQAICYNAQEGVMVSQTTYREQSRVFLEQAYRELREGDLHQASEKGWGAASQMVKAVADERRWDHSRHQDLFTAVSRLRRETGDRAISRLFEPANFLHTNFYEGTMDQDDVEDALERVGQFVDKLEALIALA